MPKDRGSLRVDNCSDDQKRLMLQYAAEVRKFEIERFWQRALLFWGFIGAALVAYAYILSRPEPTDKSICFFVGCFGLVCSVAWALQNRGSKYWQEAWEQKVNALEDVLGAPLFSNPEPRLRKGFWGAAPYSVSRLVIALSDFTVLAWIALGYAVCPWDQLKSTTSAATIVSAVSFLYILALIFLGRSRRP